MHEHVKTHRLKLTVVISAEYFNMLLYSACLKREKWLGGGLMWGMNFN